MAFDVHINIEYHENCVCDLLEHFEPTSTKLLSRNLFESNYGLNLVYTKPTRVKLVECCRLSPNNRKLSQALFPWNVCHTNATSKPWCSSPLTISACHPEHFMINTLVRCSHTCDANIFILLNTMKTFASHHFRKTATKIPFHPLCKTRSLIKILILVKLLAPN